MTDRELTAEVVVGGGSAGAAPEVGVDDARGVIDGPSHETGRRHIWPATLSPDDVTVEPVVPAGLRLTGVLDQADRTDSVTVPPFGVVIAELLER